jgi:hypothetical protein
MAKSIVPSVKNNVKRDPPATVHLKGWLYKQKHGKSKAFHKRYFILYGEELRYYKSQVQSFSKQTRHAYSSFSPRMIQML